MLFFESKTIVLFLLLYILKFNKCLTHETIGCDSMEDFQDFANREPLDLDFIGDIKTFTDVKIMSIVPQSSKLYIDARLENVDERIDLIIFTTENFKNYVYEQTSTSIAFNVIFECPDEKRRTLIFYQPIKEGNYFAPKFTKDIYTFIVPTPLYNGFDLTIFEEISAIDYDLTGNGIEFSSTDSEYYQISIGTLKRDGRTSFAYLKLLSIFLSLKENMEFSIIAMDAGTPPKFSLSKVVIIADILNNLPPIPQFVKALFHGNLTENLKLSTIEIALEAKTYTSDVSFRKLFDENDIFKIENIDNVVYVSLNKELDLQFIQGTEQFTFDIEASNSRLTETGRTAVLIKVPQKKGLRFEKKLYEGKLYVYSKKLQIEDFEVILDENLIEYLEFELQGPKNNLFNISHNTNFLKLYLEPNALSAMAWSNITYLAFTLIATMNSYESGSTSIIIGIVHTTLSFQKSAYIGIIDSEGELVLDPIVLLSNHNSTDDVNIQLMSDDAYLFSYTKNGNEIEIKLKKSISENDFQNKNYLNMEIEAMEYSTGARGSCFIIIEKSRILSAVSFQQNIYQAYIGTEGELTANNIVLDEDAYNEEIIFSLLGPYAHYFIFKQNRNVISLTLNANYTLQEYLDLNSLWIEVKAVNRKENIEAFAVVLFDIIHKPVPEFEENNYIGEITKDNIFKLQNLVVKLSTWTDDTLINLTGDYSNLFEYIVTENNVKLSLKSVLPQEVKMQSSIVLVITASNNNMIGYSTVIINLPKNQNLTNIFKEPIQRGNILQGEYIQELKINDIEFVKNCNVADLTCKLHGDESKYIDYSAIVPNNVIKLNLAAEVSKEVMGTKFYITILLQCNDKEDASVSGSTIIFLGLPGSNVTNDCPIPEPPTFIPQFQSAVFYLYSKPNYVGPLSSVHATITGSADVVKYSLHVIDEYLRSRIYIDGFSGEIFLTSVTSPGRYFFDVTAENIVTRAQTQAKAILDIEALIQCEDYVCVSNSLLIKYLEEEVVHNSILNAKLEHCEYKIYDMEPHDREYVKIDSDSKMLTMIPTDREDLVFKKMVLPQIEVKLKLDCSNENNITRSDFNNRRRSRRDVTISEPFVENRSVVLTNDIIFSKDVTVLSLILVDINDNRPEFVYPNQKRIVVGFPDDDCSQHIFSENLIQVVALDNDVGLNAEIRYTIQPNEHFQIAPKSGTVYPCANAMQEINEIDLTVYAVDRDGASDGLSSKFNLVIKLLTREHFALLTFVSEGFQTINTLIEDVRSRTGLNISAVNQATLHSKRSIPQDDFRMLRTSPMQFIQKVWIYAIEGDLPILSKDIKHKLFKIDSDNNNISVETFNEVMHSIAGRDLICVNYETSYIAVICLLSILIAACMGFIIWRYIHGSYMHNDPKRNLSMCDPVNQNTKQATEVDIQKQTELLGEALSEPSIYSKRESVRIIGTTTQESTDDGKRLQLEKLNSSMNIISNDNDNGNESDSSREFQKPRTTVTFNELVERIHIESDVEEKNKLR